ncbi:thioredoxin domain-containing protein 6-like [Homarus americanus]|uniref:thioredoxin domain-containing protein 6-like n=1 Tax=Homarus americanus TaxID=6706 RepID=UPI001C48165A|nr:thioredoxin domain-containing protein 6-like [Homarus americanus]
MTGHLRRIKLELGDEYLTLAMARADSIEALTNFRGKAEPTWLFLGSGKPMTVIHGADGPQLLNTIRRLLKVEVAALKGRGERQVVLLDSLLKPEEVVEPDEDLDDAEGELHNLDDSEENSEAEETVLQQGVLFILPHIISQDKAEIFLSNVVAAGFEIAGHVQEELTRKELHDLLCSHGSEEEEEEEKEIRADNNEEDGSQAGNMEESLAGNDNTDKTAETAEEETVNESEGAEEKTAEGVDCDTQDDVQHWEEQLSHGPLYMLLLKVEEGCVVTTWYQVLGPPDLEMARRDQPESLVAQFGEVEYVVPAWLPRGRQLQERLGLRFFPPPPDASVPRLLLLPDTDHHQVLENMSVGGVRVLAHTQATLQQEALHSVPSLNASHELTNAVGSVVLAVVVDGEG